MAYSLAGNRRGAKVLSKSFVAYAAALGVLWPAVSSADEPPSPAAPAAQSSSAPASGRDRIRPDEAVRRGVLANGLRYAVLRNATPDAAVSVRLGFDVGSYEETDVERGVAHFVEHMAFNGTRNVPEDQIEKLFAPMGVGFGRDLNASTDLFATIYQLDLPDDRAEPRAMGLRWLRDVADGLTFDEAAVARERGVIRAEADSRDGPGVRLWRSGVAFRGPELRSTARDPIGTPQAVASTTAARLRGFYDRWYRPEHAVVVMVGDLPVETMEAELKAAFEGWRGGADKPARAPVGAPDPARGLEGLAVAEAHLPTGLSVCRMQPSEPVGGDELGAWRRATVRRIWSTILDKRFAALRLRTGSAVAAAGAQRADTRDAAATCVGVTPLGDDWRGALTAVQAELRRFAADGPTELEVEAAVEEIRSRHRGSVSEAPTRTTVELAEDLLEAELEKESFVTPREGLRLFNLAVEDLTPELVKAAFARDWAGSGPLLVLNTPQPPASEALVAAWREGEAAPALARYEDRETGAWAYESFGPVGKVAARETVAAGDYVRLRFQNGLVVNYKQTDFQKEAVQVRLRFGAGRRELGRMNLTTATLGTGLTPAGGLGRHSAEDLKALFGNSAWGTELELDYDGFFFHGASNRSGLEVQLSVLAAFVTDPGFRESVDLILPTAIEATYRSYTAVPALTASDAMARALDPEGPAAMPDKQAMMKFRTADFARMFKPILTEAPLELTVVGDVPEAEVVRLVSSTLGALPARKPGGRARPDAWFMRFPDAPIEPVRALHDGPADQGLAMAVWPLYVATPSRRKEEYALGLLAEILASELRLRVRERLGMTYSPDAATSMPDDADQGTLVATVEARPGDLEAVLAEVQAVAAGLARGEITREQLDAARRPMLASMRANAAASNELWAAVLDGSSVDDQGVRDLLEYADVMNSLTVDDLRAAAARWLAPPPLIVTAVPASSPASVRAAR